jgi:hypothetical protein
MDQSLAQSATLPASAARRFFDGEDGLFLGRDHRRRNGTSRPAPLQSRNTMSTAALLRRFGSRLDAMDSLRRLVHFREIA